MAGAKIAFAEYLAVENQAIALGRRVGKAVADLNREDVVTGRGRSDGAAPANGVVVGADFGAGLAFSQSAWTRGSVSVATGRPVQSGVAKNSVLSPLLRPKAVRGTGTPRLQQAWSPARTGWASCCELLHHAVERSDRVQRRADVVAEDGRQ